jgi:hypothetical protein
MLNLKESIQPESPQYKSNEQRENYKKVKITQHDLSHKYHEAGIRTYVSNGKPHS